MKTGNLIKLIALIVLVTVVMYKDAYAINPVANIIQQKNIPITIKSYEVDRDDNRVLGAGITHKISYKNTGKQRIEAIEFSFVSFDIWNEFLSKLDGVSMNANDVGDSENGTWSNRPYAAFSFQTGFVYVSRIRFDDGRIWKFNNEEIKNELVKIQADFDMKNLDTKSEKP